MTEQEYIDSTDLAKLRLIKSILQEIAPENSSIIDKKSYIDIYETIVIWSDELREKINIED